MTKCQDKGKISNIFHNVVSFNILSFLGIILLNHERMHLVLILEKRTENECYIVQF